MENLQTLSPAQQVNSISLIPNKDDKSHIWLRDQVALSTLEIFTVHVQIGPDLARAILNHNPNNRKVSAMFVTEYARDMTEGLWKDNGEGAILAKTGELNDGQHRMMAIILSGVTIPMSITFGVDRDSRDTVDQGKLRSTGDFLAMEGIVDGNTVASSAKFILQWQKFKSLKGRAGAYKPTKSEVLHFIRETPKLLDAVRVTNREGMSVAGSRSLMAFFLYCVSIQSSKQDIERFIHGLTKGSSLADDSPILYTRNRLLLEKGRLTVPMRAELLFKTWNAHRRGETPRSFILSGTSDLPELDK